MIQFEWDGEKARRNITKHGIGFEEAVSVFFDPLAATFEDTDHSAVEQRYITVGYSSFGRLLIVSHTERGESVRIISARTATTHERKRHEEKK